MGNGDLARMWAYHDGTKHSLAGLRRDPHVLDWENMPRPFKVYPDLARVPSWNYLAVHCTVQATLVEDGPAKDRLLKKLIGDHEPPYADQWRALGEAFADKMLPGIMGFELRVTELQCKVKINQHRPESHAALKAGYAAGSDNERALPAWMDELGLGR